MLRLTSSSDYARLRQSQYKVVGKYFLIVYIEDTRLTENITGITVSKKIGNAVERNRVKRRVKAFLQKFSCPIITKAFLCNIIACKSVVDADWLSICRDLESCFKKIQISIN